MLLTRNLSNMIRPLDVIVIRFVFDVTDLFLVIIFAVDQFPFVEHHGQRHVNWPFRSGTAVRQQRESYCDIFLWIVC